MVISATDETTLPMACHFVFSALRKTSPPKLEVILGGHTVKAFVAAPKSFDVMGIVRKGQEYGLLAKTGTGSYVRINGSQVQELDTDSVEAAIARMHQCGRGESYATTRMHTARAAEPRRAPTVIIRKHRRIQYGDSVPVDARFHAR